MEIVAVYILALGIAAFFVGFIVLFAMVARELHKLMILISAYREGKRFFKQIERFRRDFSK